MPKVVFDANAIVSAALKENSIPERALLLARSYDVVCLSDAVVAEIEQVLLRPKLRRVISDERRTTILDILLAAAYVVNPVEAITDCRDAKDNKYLELALAADAGTIVSGDIDLLDLDPWRGIRIVQPAEYVASVEARESG